MKMKGCGIIILQLLVVLAVIATIILTTKAIFESDMPLWLKYLILK